MDPSYFDKNNIDDSIKKFCILANGLEDDNIRLLKLTEHLTSLNDVSKYIDVSIRNRKLEADNKQLSEKMADHIALQEKYEKLLVKFNKLKQSN